MTVKKFLPNHKIDPRTIYGDQAYVTQSFVEANVKRGTQHFIEEEITMNASQVLMFSFVTGSQPVIIKFRDIRADDRVRYEAYEDAVFSNQGTPGSVTIKNYNSMINNPSECEARTGAVASNLGTLLTKYTTPRSTNQSLSIDPFSVTGIERVLKPNTNHLLVLTNLITNTPVFVRFYLSFYEGPLSVNLL